MPKESYSKDLLKDGKNQLMANLNEDAFQGKFIRNGVFRFFYSHLVNLSSLLFLALIFYLTSINFLEKVDLIAYLARASQKPLLFVIFVLTLFLYWTDEMLQHEEAEGTEQEKLKAEEEDWTPHEKMWVQFSADILRVIDYYLIFHILEVETFAGSSSPQLALVRYTLIVMWVLFTLRKIIFWVNILGLQKVDVKGWSVAKQIPDKVGTLYNRGKQIMGQLQEMEVEAKKHGVDIKTILAKKLV